MRFKVLGSKINQKAIDKKIGDSKKFQKKAQEIANQKFNEAKSKLLEEFDAHPITQEIEGGAQASNISGTLSGYGNLFSFIGFSQGSNPAGAVRNFLQSFVRMREVRKRKGVNKEFAVDLPTMKDFNFAAMPWESGNNWVRAVEMGISNFSYYMNKASNASRSGKGIQIDGKIRSSSSKGMPYMRQILSNFKGRLSK
tara:strand:- start:1191 stop:1781 length:591 start_codon:yes stop_codon:yes gene_type:complete